MTHSNYITYSSCDICGTSAPTNEHNVEIVKYTKASWEQSQQIQEKEALRNKNEREFNGLVEAIYDVFVQERDKKRNKVTANLENLLKENKILSELAELLKQETALDAEISKLFIKRNQAWFWEKDEITEQINSLRDQQRAIKNKSNELVRFVELDDCTFFERWYGSEVTSNFYMLKSAVSKRLLAVTSIPTIGQITAVLNQNPDYADLSFSETVEYVKSELDYDE